MNNIVKIYQFLNTLDTKEATHEISHEKGYGVIKWIGVAKGAFNVVVNYSSANKEILSIQFFDSFSVLPWPTYIPLPSGHEGMLLALMRDFRTKLMDILYEDSGARDSDLAFIAKRLK